MNITPQHPGESGALVPVDDASEKPDSRQFYCDVDLTRFLLELWAKHHKMHEAEWSHLKRNMIRARNYYDGRQYGYVNNHFQWIDYEKRPGEVNYVANITQYHVQTILMEVSRGRTQLAFSHVNNESREGQLIARIAEQRYKTHKRRTFDASKEQQENLSWILNGLTIRYTYPTFKKGRGGKYPIFSEEEIAGESTVVCAECSAPMDVDGPNECGHCGSTETREIAAGSMRVKKVKGYEQAATFCETEWIPIDPLGITFYLHASCVEETPFILWEQQVFKDVLEAKYPMQKIQEGITSDALRYKMDSATSSPNVDGLLGDGGNTQGLAQLDQGWFDVELYGHKKVQSDTKLRNGTIIPAGTPLGKAFPNGLFIAKNANTILDIYGESKNDKFTIAPYVSRVGTMIGAGMSVALSNQDTKNDLRNLHMQSIMNDAFRKEFIDPQYINPDDIPNDPTERGVLHHSPENGRILGAAIDVLPPSPLSTDAYAIEERIDGEIQAQLGTFAGNSVGAPDLKAVQDTAAGMQMWREMTVGRFFPMLSTKADALDKEQAYQFLLNDQKYLSPEQWADLKGDYGEEALKLFLNCDLRKELIIEVVPESFMPQSTAQKQANIMGFTKFIMDSQTPPNSELGAYVAEQFSIPKHIIGHDAHYSIAVAMVGAFKVQADQVIAEFGDIPTFDLQDPIVASLAELVVTEADVPFDAEMNDAGIITDGLKDWWVKDTGRASSNLLKAAVLYRMAEIKAKMVMKAQEDQMYAMAAQEPAMQMQQQQAAAQQAQAAEQQMAQQQMQAEREDALRAEQNAREDEKWQRDMEARAVEKLMDIEQEDKRAAEANQRVARVA